jgi:hypothetical protein
MTALPLFGLFRFRPLYQYLAVWQCLLEFRHAFIRDIWSTQVQQLEVDQPCEVNQARVRDLGVGDRQPFKLVRRILGRRGQRSSGTHVVGVKSDVHVAGS